jgi:tetratricopeptide (TPR) repeat protein
MVIQEYDNLLRALEVALQKATTFDIAYRLIGRLFSIVFGYGDWDRWLIYLEEAICLSQELNYDSEEAALLSYRASIYIYKGEHEQARELYSRCVKKYELLNDKANYAITLTKLASVNEIQGNSKESLAFLEDALHVAKSINDSRVLMQVNLALSNVYHISREWDFGLLAAQSAYDLAGQLGEAQVEMLALLNVAAFHTELGDWQEIEAVSPKIEETLTMTGDLIRLAQFKNNMGIAAFNQGHYYVAERAWQDALQINSQVDRPIELARIYNNLGMVYTKLNEFDAAEKILKQAVAIFEEKGDKFNWANTLDNLADIYEAQGSVIEFNHTLNLALSLLVQDPSEPHVQKLMAIINGRLVPQSTPPSL